ncbi:Homoserine/homoserine lactone efflux protein [Paraburkholderia sediminicola]|uniref:Homoserine/homoserine lactone efflux protein n=2 Tax=Paraburkholderia sediminicola TaxID=458836 RepID=A0A6J5AH66_9BURK|nr:Homoserine/homoserine lactone efflux protein [Paraburkholderia sediminicola]
MLAKPQPGPPMSIQLYVSFLLASLVLVYSPGPVNVLTMSQALSAGWRAALPCVWGGTCAVLLQLAFTALCLNSLLLIDVRALTALRWAGAIYLVYLGCKQWRSGSLAASAGTDQQSGLFWRGFATSGLNPKTLLFFPSFFPQFISAPSDEVHWSANQQYLLLAATFALVFALGVASTAVFSHRLRTVLQRPKRLRAVNRLMGSLLVGMGALMAAVR